MDKKELLKQFISKNFNVVFDGDIDEYTNLFQLGFINSYGYLQIMSFIESEFDVAMNTDDLLASMPSSLSSFYEFVEQRRA